MLGINEVLINYKNHIGENNLFSLYLVIVLAASNNFSTVFLIIKSAQLTLQARNFSRKIIILQTNHNQTANTRQDIRSKKLEINIFILVLTMSILFTLFRLNDFTYSLYDCLFLFNIVSDYEFLSYFMFITLLFTFILIFNFYFYLVFYCILF